MTLMALILLQICGMKQQHNEEVALFKTVNHSHYLI